VGKRAVILAAATRAFLERGYGAASMDAIARMAGVSKQTVYAHFGGKAALFEEMMMERSDWLLQPIPASSQTDQDPRAALDTIARRFLEIIMAPESIARFRLVMAESARFPELAEVFYRSGPGRASAGLAEYLARLARDGVLHVVDPQLSAGQFFGMLRGDVFIRRLLGLGLAPTEEDVDRLVAHAVGDFLAAHTPRSTPA
jgi:AcrR family transcriptional regulator